MNKKVIWGIPVAMVVVGLFIVLLSHFQPAFTATVTNVGQVHYTPARKAARSRSAARYRVELTVEYTDAHGGSVSTEVMFSTINSNAIPKAGDKIRICQGLNDMITHPSKTLIGIGGGGAVIGGLFLFLFMLTEWSIKRKERRS